MATLKEHLRRKRLADPLPDELAPPRRRDAGGCTTERERETAYQCGWNDFERGRRHSATDLFTHNPYPEGGELARLWRQGNEEARQRWEERR